jgi:hypothetical protein
MGVVPWDETINFASALLLHSCLTILFKEFMNAVTIVFRLGQRLWYISLRRKSSETVPYTIILDAYTSIFSKDADGEQAELYFTNTGVITLAVSLAASVAMNLLAADIVLNMIIAGTFGLCFLASVLVGRNHFTLPIMALRRAGRFIWSDTPFVNFFSLIYIATVLHGESILRLRDYVTFRSVAALELVFMKAKLAASNPGIQEKLMRTLIESEWTLLRSVWFIHLAPMKEWSADKPSA